MIFYISLERTLILTCEMFFYGGKQKDSLLIKRSLSFYFVIEIKIIKRKKHSQRFSSYAIQWSDLFSHQLHPERLEYSSILVSVLE